MKYIFILLVLFSNLAFSSSKLNIIIDKGVLRDYKLFIENKNPLEIKRFNYKASRRSVVELVLFQQALNIGGYKASYNFILSPSSQRSISQIQEGKGISTSSSLWLYELEKIKEDVYISIPMIKDKQFEAGLYTHESNITVLNSKSLEDIQKLNAVSNKNWIPDWQTLNNLKLNKVFHTIKWTSMTRMVHAKRADFLLAPFQSTNDLSFKTEKLKFVPIPNIKVGLKGSRHFGISKKHKDSQKIYKALNKGLQILKNNGVIKKAYEEAGFFNQKVKEWKKLN